MNWFLIRVLAPVMVVAGCEVANGGQLGGAGGGGNPVTEHSSYTLSCGIEPLVLDFAIELTYELDPPYAFGSASMLTFSAAVVFDEATSSALVDAGTPEIDIISMEITSSVQGAAPSTIETLLGAAPINDFDLEVDTDDNGTPGPHRLELDAVTVSTAASDGATEVELGLGLEGVSLVLGDFEAPMDCRNPSLVGSGVRFPVQPSSGLRGL